jgi:hypothetical protein
VKAHLGPPTHFPFYAMARVTHPRSSQANRTEQLDTTPNAIGHLRTEY